MSENTQLMIEVKNLSRSYGTKLAVRDVSFSVRKGEILGFLGPNAAGKSTTMKVLTGFLPLESGSVVVAGIDVTEHPVDARRHIGYLPENVPLYPDFSVRDYLRFHADIKGVARKLRESRVNETLERCMITDVSNQLIGKLSKGYRQRVGLAMAIIHKPDVIILDEPTVGLDPVAIRETRELIKSLGGEHTVLLSTHILPEVSMTCQRVVIIHEGVTVAEDTPENLSSRINKTPNILLELEKGSPDLLKELSALDGVVSVNCRETNHYSIEVKPDMDLRADVAGLVIAKGGRILSLQTHQVSLEDVFVQLTTKDEEVSHE